MNEIERYLEVCGYQPDDLINIATQQPGHKFYPTLVKVSDAAKQIATRPRIANVWIGANPVRPVESGRGKATDIDRIAALYADLDVKADGGLPSFEACWAVINGVSELIQARPVTIVLSGHGLQPRWRLDEDWPNDQLAADGLRDFGRLVKLVAERHGGTVDGVYDRARILRAPGTVNVKDPENPITVQTQFPAANQEDRVELWALQDAFDDYLTPIVATPATDQPRATSVDLARGSKWLESALRGIQADLTEAQEWPPGYTKTVMTQNGEQQIGWDKLTADKAKRLASLVVAEWCPLTEEEAHTFLLEHAPRGDGWGDAEIEKKWQRELAQAEPALPPVEKVTQSIDPLEDNYVPPTELPLANEPKPELPVNDGWPIFAQTDKGYAARIAHRYGAVLRYSPKLDSWLRYVDGRWVEDKLGGQWAAHELTGELYELEGGRYDDTNEYQIGNRVTTDRREFARYVRGQEATSRVKAASDMLRASAMVNVELSEFDTDVMLINAANKVVDVRTGEVLDHSPALMMRKRLSVPYDPDAKCPEFEAFLKQALPNPELRAYLQRIVGYSLTGSTIEQVIVMHRGPTASGKSVFVRVLSAMMGEYARPMPESLLLHKNTEAHPTGIAGLEGCRVVFTDETPQGARWDEALLKRLTGETPITARGMHQDFRDFRLVAKAHIVTNYPPHLSNDAATHRRLRLVPWDSTRAEGDRDPHLADRIVASELPGVLAWAVRGAQGWQEMRGLAEPVDAENARLAYFEEEDEFGEWLRENTVETGEGGFLTPSKLLYQDYANWVRSRGGSPMVFQSFGRELGRRKRISGRTAKVNGWRMALQNVVDAAQDPLA